MNARDFISARAMAMAHRLGPVVRPLVATSDGRHCLAGSCVLVRLGSEVFLFTAAHVLDEPSLLLGLQARFVRLEGEAIKSMPPADKGREDDSADVGIVRLASGLHGALGDTQVLSSAELDVDDRATPELPTQHYLVIGFPGSRATFNVARRLARFEGFVLTTTSVKPEVYQRLGFPEHAHVVLAFDQRSAKSPDGRSISPKLSGVSGGGIWNLGDSSDTTHTTPRLAAIAAEWHQGATKAIVGTRVSLHCEVLRQHRPDLAALLPQATRIHIKHGSA